MKHFYLLLIYFLLIFIESFSQSFQGTPFSLTNQFNGNYDITAIGNTLNPNDNIADSDCYINTSSSTTLSLQPNQNVVAAYLYWSGSGDGSGNGTVSLNGNSVNSQVGSHLILMKMIYQKNSLVIVQK